MSKIKAENFFHVKPENLNCAQAIIKAYQEKFNIPESIISEFRAWGGGRAPNGICGALYAADFLANRYHFAPIRQEFKAKAGAITCLELKREQKTPCVKCVQIVDELIENKLKDNDL